MRHLYFVDVAKETSAFTEWQQLLLQLPVYEQEQVTRYVFAKDQKLALVSRLLQRKLIHDLFGLNVNAITIARTPENKPYWDRNTEHSAPLSWNFNVSHHGTVVAIASDSQSLVGVDIVRLTDRPHRSIHDFFRAFTDHFHSTEWQYIHGLATAHEDGQYTRFYRLWSLKEAYSKAVGVGLGFSFLRTEFVRARDDQWQVLVDGERNSDWHFTSTQVNDEYLVSVAYGPFAAMWNPVTSSVCQSPSLPTEPLASSLDDMTVWQEWTVKDLGLKTDFCT